MPIRVWTFLFISCFTQSCLANSCWNLLYKINVAPAHEAITADLFNGRIIRADKISLNGNNHALWKVQIYNDATGRTRNAFLKPRQLGDEDGWSRTPMEYLAYALNRRLGMDYVPPTAYKKSFSLNGHWINEASITYEVPEAKILYDTPSESWNTQSEGVTSDHRILSVLLNNQDGHYKNLLLGKHWVDGALRPAFIDFGAGLRPGANISITHYPAFRNSSNVEKIRRRTFDHLKRLHWNDLQEWREFVSEDEMRGILHRREGIIKYFEKLMSERGYNAVLIED